MKLSIASVRALNEYRRAALPTYLGLRYTLEAASARSQRWADEIAPELVARLPQSAYLKQLLFKEFEGSRIKYRKMYFPSANEALAESSLLAACQIAGGAFRPKRGIYSYHLSRPEDTTGFFRRYTELFRARQAAIARRCKRHPNHIVLYADIRNFYPSVSCRRAVTAWKRACSESNLPLKWKSLGEILLKKQSVCGKGKLLVGPRLSHLVASLVLRPIDVEIAKLCRGGYYRYVDDFALVIPRNMLDLAKRRLKQALAKAGLRLHPSKFFEMKASEWRSNAFDQDELEDHTEGSRKWMRFVDGLKGYLVTRPERHEDLRSQLARYGFRLPLPRYRNQVKETEYVGRFASRLQRPWFLRRTSRASISGIIHKALHLRVFYIQEFNEAWSDYLRLKGIQNKWAVTRVRFLLTKLSMLASQEQVSVLREATKGHAPFLSHHAVLRAIDTGSVSRLLQFGASTCAVAGELITGSDFRLRCNPPRWSQAAIDGYITLRLQGVHFSDSLPAHVEQRRLVRLVEGRLKAADWAKLDDPFIRELAALTGASSLARHRDLISAPLDVGESISSAADLLDPEIS